MEHFPPPGRGRSAVVLTLGCKLNQAESETIARGLAAAGWQITDRPAPADAFVINTCAVTHVAARKSRHYVRLARRLSPGATVVVTGCAVQTEGEEALRQAGAHTVCPVSEKPDIVARLARGASAPDAREAVSPRCRLRTRSFVKIQEGCNQVCSFCVVPRTRGSERSVPLEDVLREVRAREAEGVMEVVLTGTQLGAYGRDRGDGGLPTLIGALLRETSVPRFRVSSLQPPDITPGLLALWRDPRLCPHFHIPLQSGSDRVLERMRRAYTADDFRRAVRLVREMVPGAAITTDVIAGFPGETEADFEGTCRVCEEAGLSRIHVFPFSRRPGTLAAKMDGQVPSPARRERVERLLRLAATLHNRFLESLLGTTESVLWERPVGRDSLWEGLTGNYARVVARSERPLENRLVPARLLRRDDGALWGDLVDQEDRNERS